MFVLFFLKFLFFGWGGGGGANVCYVVCVCVCVCVCEKWGFAFLLLCGLCVKCVVVCRYEMK